MRTPKMSSDVNVRSNAYCVAHTLIECWHCGRTTPIVALALPPGHETRGDPDENEPPTASSPTDGWDRIDACALLSVVREISGRVQHRLQRHASAFRRSDSPSGSESHWENHCDHCGCALEDDPLHSEPDLAFVPTTPDRAGSIVIEAVYEPLEAGVDGYSLAPLFLDVP